MKRRLLIVLIIILCILMAACGESASPAEELTDTPLEPPSFIGQVTDSSAGKEPYPDYSGRIVISEVMPKNKTTMINGRLDDWAELLNLSDEDIVLDGWLLKCDGSYDLTGTVIHPGERLLVFASDGFSIKDISGLCLYDPDGRVISEADIPELDNNVSWELNAKGEYSASLYPTPACENSREGYCEYQNTLLPEGDIVISEVVVYNTTSNPPVPAGGTDWVEIKNISDKIVDLSEYSLTDKVSEPGKYRFPKKELRPGEYFTVLCTVSDDPNINGGNTAAPFNLNAGNETLILSRNNAVEDCVSLKDIPYGGSFGRMDGEAGFFYFEKPSYGKKNTNGYRYVTASPSASIPGGLYTTDESLLVELEGPGTIYYTLDCSEPTTGSKVYSGPIEISETTVLRAFSYEQEQIRSRSVTYNYLLNTEHTLPVVCINSNDAREMGRIYAKGDKITEILGNVSYYDNDGSFSENCTISMNGGTTLLLKKKSMIVRFRGACGCSMLKYPLFEEGVNEFNALVLRVGQDYFNAVIRNELCQKMAAQFSDDLLTQRGKWCVVYLNGEYYGIHALKENDNAYLYAHRYGVSKDSVIMDRSNVLSTSPLYPALNYIINHDMSDEANYRKACELMDMNSMADWIVAEGYSANPDLVNGNLKYAFSTEDDGRIRLIYYDLDSALSRPGFTFANLFRPVIPNQISYLCNSLIKNSSFRELVLRRVSDALHGAFSDENALAIIDEMVAEIDSEMVRDAARWRKAAINYKDWQKKVDTLKKFVDGYHNTVVNNLRPFLRLTDEEVEKYFGDLN